MHWDIHKANFFDSIHNYRQTCWRRKDEDKLTIFYGLWIVWGGKHSLHSLRVVTCTLLIDVMRRKHFTSSKLYWPPNTRIKNNIQLGLKMVLHWCKIILWSRWISFWMSLEAQWLYNGRECDVRYASPACPTHDKTIVNGNHLP